MEKPWAFNCSRSCQNTNCTFTVQYFWFTQLLFMERIWQVFCVRGTMLCCSWLNARGPHSEIKVFTDLECPSCRGLSHQWQDPKLYKLPWIQNRIFQLNKERNPIRLWDWKTSHPTKTTGGNQKHTKHCVKWTNSQRWIWAGKNIQKQSPILSLSSNSTWKSVILYCLFFIVLFIYIVLWWSHLFLLWSYEDSYLHTTYYLKL